MRETEFGGYPCILHEAEGAATGGLALTHGAGSNRESAVIRAFAVLFAERGFHVIRYDLPYRRERPSGPPRPGDAARDRDGIAALCLAFQSSTSLPVWAGGHSYGGRQTSMLAASSTLFKGLLLLSYPLHPPRKLEQLRTAHFPQLVTPVFFVHGARDPFGSPGEMENALNLIPARTHLELIQGQGHDLKKIDGPAVADRFVDWVRA